MVHGLFVKFEYCTIQSKKKLILRQPLASLPVTHRQVNVAVPTFGQHQIEGEPRVVKKHTRLIQLQRPLNHAHHVLLDVEHVGHPIRVADFQRIASPLDSH